MYIEQLYMLKRLSPAIFHTHVPGWESATCSRTCRLSRGPRKQHVHWHVSFPEVRESSIHGRDQSEPRSDWHCGPHQWVDCWLFQKMPGYPSHSGKCCPIHTQPVWTFLVRHTICTGRYYMDFFASFTSQPEEGLSQTETSRHWLDLYVCIFWFFEFEQ